MPTLPLYLRDPLFACYVNNPWAEQNRFRSMTPEASTLPQFAAARSHLPQPTWEGHEAAVACYWKAWELAFANLRRPTAENGFVANYIDTAFNGHLFLWDSVFILMFGRYGSRAFNFQRTLDNLYARQHPDGFICREIDCADGQDCFHRHDPDSTGPNVLAWSEWEYYRNTGDRERLGRVFPVLVAYHQWLREYRTWPDGTYWSCGWACGMDNQPRVPAGYSPAHSPAHQGWVDASLQMILSAQLLGRMAEVLGQREQIPDMQRELEALQVMVNARMWDEATAFYYDVRRDGRRADVKSIGAYWALLAEVVPADRLERFIAHLEDPAEFNRPHRIPSLSADHPAYKANGSYWLGSVWAPTQYMTLRGLTALGHDRLAHDIALNHVRNVTAVFEQTGTLWENYAPESASPGDPAQPDFVGFGGVAPIAVLFESVFGLRPEASEGRLVWDVRLLDAHGISQYPFAATGVLELHCEARSEPAEAPRIRVLANCPLKLELRGARGQRLLDVSAGVLTRT
jgi:hypothetical protein